VTYSTNTILRLLETVSTKQKTEFSPWWLALNGELAKRNMPEARHGEARNYYVRQTVFWLLRKALPQA